MSKLNIFKASYRMALEDKFTYCLAYILNKNPKVAQEYFDKICLASGLKKNKFIEAVDHPFPTITCKPDFLIRGKDYDVLFEHKLDSALGADQLSRYLKIASDKKQKLCFVANYLTEVSSAVLSSEHYLKTKHRDHFVWSDFYYIFAKSNDALAKEFADWMHSLGMDPDVWPGHADPFVDKAAIDEFKGCFVDLKKLIDNRFGSHVGRMVKRGPVRPCMEIRKALPKVHLLYINLEKVEEAWGWEFHGPFLQFSVIVKDKKLLLRENGVFKTNLGDVSFYHVEDTQMTWDLSLYETRTYYVEASKFFNKNTEVTKKNLECVTISIMNHLKAEIRD